MSTIDVAGRRLTLTNLGKPLWPSGFTKGEMIEYYLRIAPVLLPHLERRPLTLRRFPDGVGGISWHQNECQGQPEWFSVFETEGRGGRVLRFCLVEDLASLVWVANKAAIELHPFLWKTDAPREPTQIVFDLDPGPPAGLLDAARVALELRVLLLDLGLTPYVKTSGSLGMHVHAPLDAPLDTKTFAREVGGALAAQLPDAVVAKVQRSARAGKVYVDWLQNDPTRQTVAPYSLRGVPTPLVATPVRWEEVEAAVRARQTELLMFGPSDVLRRIESDGDLFCDLR